MFKERTGDGGFSGGELLRQGLALAGGCLALRQRRGVRRLRRLERGTPLLHGALGRLQLRGGCLLAAVLLLPEIRDLVLQILRPSEEKV